LAAFGWPVLASRLPGPLLTRAWSKGLVPAPAGFDVVHAISLATPPVQPAGGADRPALVVVVHDLAWRRHPESTTPRGRRWHEAALARAVRHADALVVPSDVVFDDLCAAGANPMAVTVIGGGTDHLPPADTVGADRVLADHGVLGEFILSVGTLEPRKNLRRLVAAYAAVRPSLPGPWPLVLVGPRGWGSAEGLVSEGVVSVGEVPEGVLSGIYARARTFAYVPLTEGFGLPPLEAMTFGVPVVASSGVPSVSRPDGSPAIASIVDPFDVDAIAAALLSASTDSTVRQTLTTAATADVSERTWRRAAAQHVSLWQAVAADGHRS
jgi:glycosyltransferase involved in cell wall biosynthesis